MCLKVAYMLPCQGHLVMVIYHQMSEKIRVQRRNTAYQWFWLCCRLVLWPNQFVVHLNVTGQAITQCSLMTSYAYLRACWRAGILSPSIDAEALGLRLMPWDIKHCHRQCIIWYNSHRISTDSTSSCVSQSSRVREISWGDNAWKGDKFGLVKCNCWHLDRSMAYRPRNHSITTIVSGT